MLAHRLLGGCHSSLSFSCPSLVSVLVAVARAHLWRSFRRCSESPLLVHPKTMVSCLLGRPRVSPGLPLGYLWHTSPLQAVFIQPTPVLSLGSDPQSRASAPSFHPSWQVSRQASQAGECWSVPILCEGISPLCPLHPCCCALLCGSDASPLTRPRLR